MNISVLIPAYNSADTIASCLASVAQQTYAPQEIIVVDDASTDDTLAVIADWERHNPTLPLRILAQPTNGGPAAARNAGIQAAGCDWIAFLDADDAWLPYRLAVQEPLVRAHPDAIMFCAATMALQESSPPPIAPPATTDPPRTLALRELLAHNPVATSTVLAKRETLLALDGFDTSFRGPEDYDLWLRMVAAGRCLHLPIPLSRYRMTIGSLSMDDRTFLPQVLRVLDKAFAADGVLAPYRHLRYRAKAEQYTSASWMAYNRGDRKRAIGLLLRALLCGPTKLAKEQQDPFLRMKLLARYLHK